MPSTIFTALDAIDACRMSYVRGESISPRDLAKAATDRAVLIRAHMGEITNANTIPAELKRQTILQTVMEDFAVRLAPLRAFSTRLNTIPLQGTSKIEVPFYALNSVEPTNFIQADGYVFAEDTSTGFREVTIDKRKYKGLAFSSEEMARQPYLSVLQLAKLAVDRLAISVLADILSIVTAANYGAAIFSGLAGAFDSDDIADFRVSCNKAHWPTTGRALILDSDYDGSLQKEEAIKAAMNYGGSEPIREGKVPRIAGFDYYESPSIPENGELLKGMVCLPPALLVATSPIMPGSGVRKALLNYDVIVHPELGIAFEYRHWGVPQSDSDYEVIECNYGFGKGNAAALQRITAI